MIANRYAHAALSVNIGGRFLQQPQLSELAECLCRMDEEREAVKGKPMSDDHLRQEAVKWARSR